MDRSASCLTVASIFVGLALALLVFRLWRDRELLRAKADYLILMPIVLSSFLVFLPLLTIPNPSSVALNVAQGSCATSAMLLAAYPFAVLDGTRARGDALFVGASALAVFAVLGIFLYC